MRRALNSFLAISLAGLMMFLLDPALSVGIENADSADSSSPLFYASLESSLSDLTSQNIDISLDVSEPEGTADGTWSCNPEPVLQVAAGPVPRGGQGGNYTSGETCMGSGGATCQGTATCVGSQTCLGAFTCAETCMGSGAPTCQGTATCKGSQTCEGTFTCSGGGMCQVSPAQ
jgi:hypothetical protein